MDFPHLSGFDSQADVLESFHEAATTLDGANLLFASYDQNGYDGSAVVVFRKDGQLFLVSGRHCSCYGLENQWSAEPTTVEAMKTFRYGREHAGWDKFVEALEGERDSEYKKASGDPL